MDAAFVGESRHAADIAAVADASRIRLLLLGRGDSSRQQNIRLSTNGEIMRKLILLVLFLAAVPLTARGDSKEQLAGAWSLVSIEFVRPDGSRSSTFGANPRGTAFFDASGHYIISVMRSDRPKYASNNFAEGTAEENKATAQGTITYFGTYSVSEPDRTIAIHIEGSSFPNWDGANQKRLFVFSGDELKLISPAASGAGTAEVVWRRAK